MLVGGGTGLGTLSRSSEIFAAAQGSNSLRPERFQARSSQVLDLANRSWEHGAVTAMGEASLTRARDALTAIPCWLVRDHRAGGSSCARTCTMSSRYARQALRVCAIA